MTSVLETEREDYDRVTEINVLSLELTSRFLAKWARNIRDVSWPESGVGFAKRVIESSNRSADSLFMYRVRVVPASEEHVDWTVGSEAKTYTYANVSAFNGLDVHVFRCNNAENDCKIWERMDARHELKDIFMKGMRHHVLSTAKDLILELHFDIFPPFAKKHYGSVILLRKKEENSTKSKFPYGLTQKFNPTYYKLELTKTCYSIVDAREATYTWRAFFFL